MQWALLYAKFVFILYFDLQRFLHPPINVKTKFSLEKGLYKRDEYGPDAF